MGFFVQYNKVTGAITGTINGEKAPVMPPDGDKDQLTFKEWEETTGKRVNLETKTLEDAPKEPQ